VQEPPGTKLSEALLKRYLSNEEQVRLSVSGIVATSLGPLQLANFLTAVLSCTGCLAPRVCSQMQKHLQGVQVGVSAVPEGGFAVVRSLQSVRMLPHAMDSPQGHQLCAC
jgi:hypothetical protein